MDEFEKKALENIEKYGCHILTIPEDDLPGFSYSIGIEKNLNKPELIIVGLKPELSKSIINKCYFRLKNGEVILPNRFYPDFLEGFEIYTIEVAKKHYREYFGWGYWLYQNWDFRVLQIIWPSTDDKWPWHEKTEFYEWAQPVLNESGKLEIPLR